MVRQSQGLHFVRELRLLVELPSHILAASAHEWFAVLQITNALRPVTDNYGKVVKALIG